MKSAKEMREMRYQPTTLDQRPCAGCGQLISEKTWRKV